MKIPNILAKDYCPINYNLKTLAATDVRLRWELI